MQINLNCFRYTYIHISLAHTHTQVNLTDVDILFQPPHVCTTLMTLVIYFYTYLSNVIGTQAIRWVKANESADAETRLAKLTALSNLIVPILKKIDAAVKAGAAAKQPEDLD